MSPSEASDTDSAPSWAIIEELLIPAAVREQGRGTEEVPVELPGYVHPPDEDSTDTWYTAFNALEAPEGSYPAVPEYNFSQEDSDQSQDSAGLSVD